MKQHHVAVLPPDTTASLDALLAALLSSTFVLDTSRSGSSSGDDTSLRSVAPSSVLDLLDSTCVALPPLHSLAVDHPHRSHQAASAATAAATVNFIFSFDAGDLFCPDDNEVSECA